MQLTEKGHFPYVFKSGTKWMSEEEYSRQRIHPSHGMHYILGFTLLIEDDAITKLSQAVTRGAEIDVPPSFLGQRMRTDIACSMRNQKLRFNFRYSILHFN